MALEAVRSPSFVVASLPSSGTTPLKHHSRCRSHRPLSHGGRRASSLSSQQQQQQHLCYAFFFRKNLSSSLSSLPSSSRLRGCRCSSADPNDDGSMKSSWDSEDSNYIEAHVVEAVSLLPSKGHLFMTLVNGREVEIDHVSPPKGKLLYRSSNPTIFLKIHTTSELFIPIIVGDAAIGMLMKAIHGEEAKVRPNQYHLIEDLVTKLNFEVRMVRVTERIADTYHARIFIGRPGEKEMQSVDARPSDAINLAVRCKVPIYVNKVIVDTDAVKPIYASREVPSSHSSSLDCPQDGHDPIAEEITLVKNMLVAAAEERFHDAAEWRDKLNSLRKQRRRIRQL